MIAMSEEIGTEMAIRLFTHFLQFSEIHIKRAVPLAIALLNISHPRIGAMDMLAKYSRDPDPEFS